MIEYPSEYVLAAGDWEGAIWVQLLVGVIVVAGVWLWYGTSRADSAGKIRGRRVFSGGPKMRWEKLRNVLANGRQLLLKQAKTRMRRRQAERGLPAAEVAAERPVPVGVERVASGGKGASRAGRDTGAGMELLGVEFLVKVVEELSNDNGREVTMRRLCFCELLRRGRLDLVASEALKEYATDRGHLFSKVIQCEALRELSRRTAEGKADNAVAEAAAGKTADE